MYNVKCLSLEKTYHACKYQHVQCKEWNLRKCDHYLLHELNFAFLIIYSVHYVFYKTTNSPAHM